MNILIVSEKSLPEFYGGKETYVFNLAKSFINQNFKVDILTSTNKKSTNFIFEKIITSEIRKAKVSFGKLWL